MKFKLFISFSALLLLIGCTASPQMDTNNFSERFNTKSEYVDFSPSDAVFYTENKTKTHLCKIDKNILLTLSSLENGTIYRCTLSFDRSGSFDIFKDCILSGISAFCLVDKEDCQEILKRLNFSHISITDGFSSNTTENNYEFSCESSQNTTVFIIRAMRYSPEANTSPTLKKH